MNDTLFHVHCVSHRVALAITDAYSESGDVDKFLAMGRVAYSFFSRSTVMRKEYMQLKSTFPTLKLRNSLCETG